MAPVRLIRQRARRVLASRTQALFLRKLHTHTIISTIEERKRERTHVCDSSPCSSVGLRLLVGAASILLCISDIL